MLAIDIESSGVDWSHGTAPFFVSVCYDDGRQLEFQWDVDPLTRRVSPPAADVKKIQDIVTLAGKWGTGFDEETALRHCVVGHNIKFDVTGLGTIGIDWSGTWDNTYDTILASHLLDSDQFHNLTDLAGRYLREDIRPYEDAIDAATKEARKMVQQARLRRDRFLAAGERIKAGQVSMADWAIAQEGREDMPSAGGKRVWKADMWLPRAVAKFMWEEERDRGWRPPAAKNCEHEWVPCAHAQERCRHCHGHHWWTVLAEYAHPDTAVTLALTEPMWAEIRRRGLWRIYREKCRQIYPFYRMERNGVGFLHTHTDQLVAEYEEQGAECRQVCVNLAAGKGWDLQLGAGGNTNDSLKQFLLGRYAAGPLNEKGQPTLDKTRYIRDERCLNLPILGVTDSGGACLDKSVMEEYENTLPPNSKEGLFIRKLGWMRKLGTAVNYLQSYRRFGSEGVAPGYGVLHPNFNMTGTAHLRSSSNNPNGQNISKQEARCRSCEGRKGEVEDCRACGGRGVTFRSLRYCFGPGPGREWWSMDYSNIERRTIAYPSNEEEVIALLERPNDPPYYGSEHLLIAHTIHKRLFEETCYDPKTGVMDGRLFKDRYKSTWYQWTKNAVFAMAYQCGEAKADATSHVQGTYRLVKQRFHRQEAFNQYQVAHANRHGYIVTIPDKAVDPKRGYTIAVPKGEYGKVKPTLPLNYFSSGTACWIARFAMVRCQRVLDEWASRDGFDGRMILLVHDELVFDFPRGANPKEDPAGSNLERAMQLRELMEEGGETLVTRVPSPVNVEWHPVSWDKGVAIR